MQLADVGSVDAALRFALYAEVKTEELALEACEPAQRLGLLRLQFDARQRGYAAQYPGAIEYVIFHDDGAAGWLVVDSIGETLHCVDIAIRPAARGCGIGTEVLRDLQRNAAALGRPLTLSVLRTNRRARALYERLDFHETAATETHVFLEWRRG
jgi:ribosomal protein S18 acetylase RimI-like enzyme